MKKTLCIMFSLFIAVFSCGCNKTGPATQTGVYFDTVVSLTVYGDKVPQSAMELCQKYDKLLSKTEKSSDISKINQSGSAVVDPETAQLILKALEYCKMSGGAFDITTAKITDLWDFSAEKPKLPDPIQLKAALKTVNYKNVTVNGNTVTLNNGAKLDLGAIAKGYIADKIGEIYKAEKLSGIINLGGNVMLVGEKPDKSKFSVGIKKPYTENEYVAKVLLNSGAVVTSGVYERGFEIDNKRYHHLLNTKTGYPVENGLDSITIIASNSTMADALSTAVFCLGAENGAKLVESLKDTYAVFLKTDGSLIITDGLKSDNGIITIEE